MHNAHPSRQTPPWAILILAILALVLAIWAALGPLDTVKPAGLNASPEQFSAQRALAFEHRIVVTERPHPIGSIANADIRHRVIEAFEQLGFAAEDRSGPSCVIGYGGADCAIVHNIVAERASDTDAHEKPIVITAHYDSVPAGSGIADDLSNIGIMLEIARMDAHHPFRAPLRFIATDGEELGMLGARYLVRSGFDAKHVAFDINLEARGTSGPSYMFEAGSKSGYLVNAYLKAVRPLPGASYVTSLYKLLPNGTDYSVFEQAGIGGLNFAFGGGLSRYHSPRDDFSHLSLASVQAQGSAIVDTVRGLGAVDSPHQQESVPGFISLSHLLIIRWPSSWTWAMNALALLLGAWGLVALVRSVALSWRSLLMGAVKAMLLFVLFLATVALVAKGTRLLTGVPQPWLAHGVWVWMAAGGIGFGLLLWLGGGGKRGAALGWFAGMLIMQLVVLVLLTLINRGLSALVLVQALVMAVGVFLLGMSSRVRQAQSWVYLVYWIVAVLVLIPAIRTFAMMLTLNSAALAAIPLALLLLSCMPLLTFAFDRKAGRIMPAVSASVGVVAFTVAMFVPTATHNAPRRANVYHVQDADHDEAWIATGRSRYALPRPLAGAAAFSSGVQTPWPPSIMGPKYVADIAPEHLSPPRLAVCASDAATAVPGTSTACLQWQDTSRFDFAVVTFPGHAGIRAYFLGDQKFLIPPRLADRGFSIAIHGQEGLHVPLRLMLDKQGLQVNAVVAGWRYGLKGAAEHLASHRTAAEVPKNSGDMAVVYANQTLDLAPVSRTSR